ncbi:unnamed protein product [Symbiodinium sp. CCMP2592]|nr:unnamed protein product [Symbiodinium sp. CCMP2592]
MACLTTGVLTDSDLMPVMIAFFEKFGSVTEMSRSAGQLEEVWQSLLTAVKIAGATPEKNVIGAAAATINLVMRMCLSMDGESADFEKLTRVEWREVVNWPELRMFPTELRSPEGCLAQLKKHRAAVRFLEELESHFWNYKTERPPPIYAIMVDARRLVQQQDSMLKTIFNNLVESKAQKNEPEAEASRSPAFGSIEVIEACSPTPVLNVESQEVFQAGRLLATERRQPLGQLVIHGRSHVDDCYDASEKSAHKKEIFVVEEFCTNVELSVQHLKQSWPQQDGAPVPRVEDGEAAEGGIDDILADLRAQDPDLPGSEGAAASITERRVLPLCSLGQGPAASGVRGFALFFVSSLQKGLSDGPAMMGC